MPGSPNAGGAYGGTGLVRGRKRPGREAGRAEIEPHGHYLPLSCAFVLPLATNAEALLKTSTRPWSQYLAWSTRNSHVASLIPSASPNSYPTSFFLSRACRWMQSSGCAPAVKNGDEDGFLIILPIVMHGFKYPSTMDCNLAAVICLSIRQTRRRVAPASHSFLAWDADGLLRERRRGWAAKHRPSLNLPDFPPAERVVSTDQRARRGRIATARRLPEQSRPRPKQERNETRATRRRVCRIDRQIYCCKGCNPCRWDMLTSLRITIGSIIKNPSSSHFFTGWSASRTLHPRRGRTERTTVGEFGNAGLNATWLSC